MLEVGAVDTPNPFDIDHDFDILKIENNNNNNNENKNVVDGVDWDAGLPSGNSFFLD